MVFAVLGTGVDVAGGSVECDTGPLLEANNLMLQLEPSHILFNSTHVGGESAIVCSPVLQRGGGAIPWVSSELFLVCVGDADKPPPGFEVI